ncbi:unnamed protein product [Symbiodinium sp. CCMP2592]|nr:unnamed protein product [Symbiodinium sp. CCMP2592]
MPPCRPTIRCPKAPKEAKLLEVEIRDFLRRNAANCSIQSIFTALAASDTFLSTFYGRMPFVIGCADAVSETWTLEDQLKLLQPGSYPSFADKPDLHKEVVKLSGYSRFTHSAIGQLKAHSFMAQDNVTADKKVTEETCENLTDELVRERVKNSTWVLSSGNSLSPRLAEVCQSLQSAFQLPFITLNVYISHLDAPVTAPLHTDRFDSFIMQTEGFKRWRIFGTSSAVPAWPVLDSGMTDRGKAGDVLYLEQVGDMLIDETLAPGDVLYLPRGFPHATSTFGLSDEVKKRGSQMGSPYSTSLTVSLLLESVGLTMDKAFRCAAGMHEGRNHLGQCFSAEEVLRATPERQSMRAVLPLGFLARTVAPELKGQNLLEDWERLEATWMEGMLKKMHDLAVECGLERWLQSSAGNGIQLTRTLQHLWRSMPIATEWCRERVYATGSILSQIPPDSRHEVEEKALIEFPFFPADGLMFAKSPSINSPVPTL